jgi:hypothetical protein
VLLALDLESDTNYSAETEYLGAPFAFLSSVSPLSIGQWQAYLTGVDE